MNYVQGSVFAQLVFVFYLGLTRLITVRYLYLYIKCYHPSLPFRLPSILRFVVMALNYNGNMFYFNDHKCFQTLSVFDTSRKTQEVNPLKNKSWANTCPWTHQRWDQVS